jgi:hypothetical protein
MGAQDPNPINLFAGLSTWFEDCVEPEKEGQLRIHLVADTGRLVMASYVPASRHCALSIPTEDARHYSERLSLTQVFDSPGAVSSIAKARLDPTNNLVLSWQRSSEATQIVPPALGKLVASRVVGTRVLSTDAGRELLECETGGSFWSDETIALGMRLRAGASPGREITEHMLSEFARDYPDRSYQPN